MTNKVIRVLAIGEKCSGKTITIETICKGIISKYPHLPTIGVDYSLINLKNFKIIFWDAGGDYNYDLIIKSFYNICDIILLFFHHNSNNAINEIIYWYNEIKKNKTNYNKNKIMLVALKKYKIIDYPILNFCQSNNLSLHIINIEDTKDIDNFIERIINMHQDIYKDYNIKPSRGCCCIN